MVIKDYPLETGPAGTIIGTLAALLFYQFWFRSAFEGHLKGGDMAIGFRSAIPYLIYLAISFVLSFFFVPDVNFRLISLQLLFTAIAAGFIEETIFRGGMLTTLLRKMDSPKKNFTGSLNFSCCLRYYPYGKCFLRCRCTEDRIAECQRILERPCRRADLYDHRQHLGEFRDSHTSRYHRILF